MPTIRTLIKVATTKVKDRLGLRKKKATDENLSPSSPNNGTDHGSDDSSLSETSSNVSQSTSKLTTGSQTTANTEERMRRGCQWLVKDVRRKVAQAARKFNVPYHKLWHRHNGTRKDRTTGQAHRSLLSPAQEEVLAEWCEYLSDGGIPLNHKTIKPRVKALTGKKPGVNWFRRFLARHPDLVSRRPAGLAPNRAQAIRYTAVRRHFRLWKKHVIDQEIPPENIYNMDEKGLQLGGGRKTRKTKFIVRRDQRPKYVIRSENLELVTVIDCIAADGAGPPPSFIFSGSTMDGRWFDYPDLHDRIGNIAVSPNGWTDDFLCLDWFINIFVPYATARNTSNQPIVLIFDGHGSHTAFEMAEHARKHNVILFCSPPHTTHLLQPLDVNFFGPIQKRWADRCDELAMEAVLVNERGMTRETVIPEYVAIRDAVMATPGLVKNAFRKTGLWPFNPDIFGDENSPHFRPSHLSSTLSHLPSSYPSALTSVAEDNEPDSEAEDPPSQGSTPTTRSRSSSVSSRLSAEPVQPSTSTAPATQTDSTSADPSLTQTPPLPSITTFANSEPTPSAPLFKPMPLTKLKRMSKLQLADYVGGLEARVATAEARAQAAEAHCALAAIENSRLKAQVNKPSKKPRETLNIDARVVTEGSGYERLVAQRKKKEVEQQEATARQQAKDAKADERLRDRQENATTRVLEGPVSKNRLKEELEEIAYSLSILARNSAEAANALRANGTKDTLVERISTYLLENPDLDQDPRFADLFRTGGRRAPKRPAAEPAIEARAPKTPRLGLEELPLQMVNHSPHPSTLPPSMLAGPSSGSYEVGQHSSGYALVSQVPGYFTPSFPTHAPNFPPQYSF